ncbi:hypothetical protein SLG_27040 [Sphingobium sp. SYK-6]|uniref:retron St85 family effector protein n=1 Tax=Sphingobium sp. (strain NBRC 103272 / SYK-6) TaxID=627192 RepID=UPI0002276F92|nr:retron St85 family effector protein [Sphingobium sp. SYK-6]BAK67379.1 hypothetical protein SLG_27040 [Sphingobium sp. SYK-6]
MALVPFLDNLDGGKIHVQAPTGVIFLCGGMFTGVDEPNPVSLRDAFLKIADFPSTRSRNVIQAEDFTKLSVFSEHYENILEFETDLAQITELIILFCESGGSLAELGAFCAIDEIASRLFVIVEDKYWSDDSFVKLGPLTYLSKRHGDDRVCVISSEDIIRIDQYRVTADPSRLKALLEEPIKYHVEKEKSSTTFNENNPGHIIKLIVGVLQEWGALTINEIDEVLLHLNVYVKTEKIRAYLLCAISVGWVHEVRRGIKTFYVAADLEKDAAQIKAAPQAREKKKERRRLSIREHWQNEDQNRWAGIQAVMSGAVR